MAWNGTTTYGQLNENWSRAWNFEKNITEILEYLKGKNITSK
jgi:ubiquitin-protein ligase